MCRDVEGRCGRSCGNLSTGNGDVAIALKTAELSRPVVGTNTTELSSQVDNVPVELG